MCAPNEGRSLSLIGAYISVAGLPLKATLQRPVEFSVINLPALFDFVARSPISSPLAIYVSYCTHLTAFAARLNTPRSQYRRAERVSASPPLRPSLPPPPPGHETDFSAHSNIPPGAAGHSVKHPPFSTGLANYCLRICNTERTASRRWPTLKRAVCPHSVKWNINYY